MGGRYPSLFQGRFDLFGHLRDALQPVQLLSAEAVELRKLLDGLALLEGIPDSVGTVQVRIGPPLLILDPGQPERIVVAQVPDDGFGGSGAGLTQSCGSPEPTDELVLLLAFEPADYQREGLAVLLYIAC